MADSVVTVLFQALNGLATLGCIELLNAAVKGWGMPIGVV